MLSKTLTTLYYKLKPEDTLQVSVNVKSSSINLSMQNNYLSDVNTLITTLRDVGDFAIIEDRWIHTNTTAITTAYNLEREEGVSHNQHFYKCDKEGYLLGRSDSNNGGLFLLGYDINDLNLFHERDYCQDLDATILLGIPYTGSYEKRTSTCETKEGTVKLSHTVTFTDSFDTFCNFNFEYGTYNSILYSEVLRGFFLKRQEYCNKEK